MESCSTLDSLWDSVDMQELGQGNLGIGNRPAKWQRWEVSHKRLHQHGLSCTGTWVSLHSIISGRDLPVEAPAASLSEEDGSSSDDNHHQNNS